MPVNILFAALPERWETYENPLLSAFSALGLKVNLSPDIAADQVDYIVYAPNSTVQDFTPYTRAKAVLNLWAGVEDVVGNSTLRIPLARMVDGGLTQGMVEWVTGHVLRHHLDTDLHVLGQDGVWRKNIPPLATDRPVAILGLGALGQACAQALAGLGFDVSGWSRSAKDVPNITCLNGDEGLQNVLTRAEIIVLLLPFTPQTENIINAKTLALMPKGAVIINPGRGQLIDDEALLEALDTDQIKHVTLDVFRQEPLPPEHPYWAHKKVTVTPHIASETRAKTAAEVIAENVRRGEASEPFLHLVDRKLGY